MDWKDECFNSILTTSKTSKLDLWPINSGLITCFVDFVAVYDEDHHKMARHMGLMLQSNIVSFKLKIMSESTNTLWALNSPFFTCIVVVRSRIQSKSASTMHIIINDLVEFASSISKSLSVYGHLIELNSLVLLLLLFDLAKGKFVRLQSCNPFVACIAISSI
jgi:hypothetical protein